MYWSMIETGLAFLVANLMVLYGLFAAVTKGSANSLRRLLPKSFASKESDPSTYREHGWPPRRDGNVETHVESAEFSVLDSKASNEAEFHNVIKTITTLEQSAHRV